MSHGMAILDVKSLSKHLQSLTFTLKSIISMYHEKQFPYMVQPNSAFQRNPLLTSVGLLRLMMKIYVVFSNSPSSLIVTCMYSYCYVCSILANLFYCVVLCIVCV